MVLVFSVILTLAWLYNFKCWADGVYSLMMHFKDIRKQNEQIAFANEKRAIIGQERVPKVPMRWAEVGKYALFIAGDMFVVILVRSLVGITKDAMMPSALIGTAVSFFASVLRNSSIKSYKITDLMLEKFKTQNAKNKKDGKSSGIVGNFMDDMEEPITVPKGNPSSIIKGDDGYSYVIRGNQAYRINN